MGRGLISGVIWGAIVGCIALAFLSLYVPRQEWQALPAGDSGAAGETDSETAVGDGPAEDDAAQDDGQTDSAAEETTQPASSDSNPSSDAETTDAEDTAQPETEDQSSVAPQTDTKPEETAPTVATQAPSVDAPQTATSENAEVGTASQDAAVVQNDVAAPQVANTDATAPSIETDLSRPNVATSLSNVPQVPELSSAEAVGTAGEDVAVTQSQTVAPQAPTEDIVTPNVETQITRPEVEIAVAAPQALETPTPRLPRGTSAAEPSGTATAPASLSEPSTGDAQPAKVANPEAPKPAPSETQTAALTTDRPLGRTISADTPLAVPVPKIENPLGNSSAKGVVVNRLPTVTGPATEDDAGADDGSDAAPGTEEASPADDGEAPATAETEVDEGAGALTRFAAVAEVPEGASLFSVVLIDEGAEGVARDALLQLSIPVTIAIDPTRPDAAETMAAYRSAGIEVLAMPSDLPEAATPSDIEVALQGYFSILDQAVGVMDPLDGRIQSNRSLLQPVLGAIRDSGHGFVTYDRGLNTAQQAARRENIPAATIYRVLDADLENTSRIKRYLDRAAFAAGQEGAVVVVGRSYQDTVSALIEWALARKDGDMAVVPISAVMLAGAG